MTKTLLEIVQTILSSMDSDEVNSISETAESVQMVDVIVDTFDFIISQKQWDFKGEACALESVGDTLRPTYLRLPDNIDVIGKLRYEATETGDENRTFCTLQYLRPEEFIDSLLRRSSGADNIEEYVTEAGTPLLILNDKNPAFYTSFDDEFIVADSYLKTKEATLQGVNTTLYCSIIPTMGRGNDDIPQIPAKHFPMFVAECKRAAHIYHKQQDSPVDRERWLAGRHKARQDSGRVNNDRKRTNFGRR